MYSHLGYNLKATDMQAAIGVEQLKKLPGFIASRNRNWEYLREKFLERGLDKYLVLPETSANSNPSWFGFALTVREESLRTRDEITRYLEEHNVQTRLLFSGNITMHPCFDELRESDDYRVIGNLVCTDYIMENTFWIGVHPGMNKDMLDYMVKCISEVFD